MKKFLATPFLLTISLSILILLCACSPAPQAEAQDPRVVLVLTADGPISAGMADYLQRGLTKAAQEDAEAVIFQLNTPGGAVTLMNRMVQDIRNSPVPVIVYVSPAGAMAGSAGTIITLAGHVAVMAPETTIGAASPVDLGGQEIDETSERKTKEIMRATVRSLAQQRPPEAISLAEETIESARAVSSSEALEIGLIDFIAFDLNDLLDQADGFPVRMQQELRRLELADAQLEEVPETSVDALLNLLTNPNIVLLLLNVGVLAVLIEISSPGGWLPGFIGIICIALAVYGLGVLPVNWFGLIFIVLAFVLFVLELKTPATGALTAAGIGSFIAGGLILFNSVRAPEFQPISVPLVIFSGVVTGLLFIGIVAFALRTRSLPVQAGQESLIGRTGIVKESLDPRGQVQIGGELWTAVLTAEETPIKRGERIVVVEVDGLRLKVKRA
jgi:membrane-bound serine protease (ClpP class)